MPDGTVRRNRQLKRILILGDDFEGPHGVVNYTRPLAERLAQSGIEVHYFYSGSQFLAYDLFLVPRIKRFQAAGIRFYKIINSPIYAQIPGSPEADLFNPTIERMLSTVVAAVRPDLVYVDSLLGLPSRSLEIIGRQSIPIVITHHVYRLFCQKGVFYSNEEEYCQGPFDLDRCSRCYKEVDARKYIWAAQLRSTLPTRFIFERIALPTMRTLRRTIAKALDARKTTRYTVRPDPAVPAHSVPYLKDRLAHRLHTNVEYLNKYVAVHICVSTDVKETLLRLGIRSDRLLVQHIGSVVAERFRPKQHVLDHQRVIIGNIGGINPYKGTHVLIQALKIIAHHNNWQALLYGRTIDTYQARLEQIFNDPRITYKGPYRFEEIDSIVDTIDIMVLPSTCNDTAPQTIFESFSGSVPIIASSIGGFPDFIRHGVNGLLFECGDAHGLAKHLASVLEAPSLITAMASNISQPKTLAANTMELLDLFADIVEKRRTVSLHCSSPHSDG